MERAVLEISLMDNIRNEVIRHVREPSVDGDHLIHMLFEISNPNRSGVVNWSHQPQHQPKNY